jgi:hypothetical protein
MKVATVSSKRRKDLIIIAILLIGLPILVFGSYQIYQLILRAAVEPLPHNILISNLTTSSVTVSWTTEIEATGAVIPVSNGGEASPVLDKRGQGKTKTHYVELVDLEPSTQYDFLIVSDSQKYDGGEDISFSFKTAPITAETPTPNPIHGTISGTRGEDIVVYAMLKDKSAYPVSAIMPKGGNWIMDLSSLRSISDGSLVSVSPSTNFVLVAISGINEGASIEGSYSELFDSNGKLKEVNAINVAQNPSLYVDFPGEAKIGVFGELEGDEVQPIEEEEQEEAEIIDPTEESAILDPEELERDYQLVRDVEWLDIVSDDNLVSAPVGVASIKTANLTDTGFSVIWVSEEQEEGFVRYGTSTTDLSSNASDERDGISTKGDYYVHMVSTSRLTPDTTYYFEIVSGEDVYDNDGTKYSVTTFPTLSSPPPFDSASGEIDGLPSHGEAVAVAYIEDKDDTGTAGESSEVAAVVDDNGRWIISIADVRGEDGNAYFEYTSGDVLKLDIITTFISDTHEEGIQGIGQRDVSIIVNDSSTPKGAKIKLLDNYGVLGYSTGTPLSFDGVEDIEEQYQVTGGTATPETGLFDSFIAIVLLSSLTVLLPILYVLRMTKKNKKGNMKNSIK